MNINDLTIYKPTRRSSRHEREAKEIATLAFGLTQESACLRDIVFACPDPPDFALHLVDGKVVGLELTTLLRRRSLKRKGDTEEAVRYPKWERAIKSSEHGIKASFDWSAQSLPEMFESFKVQVLEKERKLAHVVPKYDELWLCFRTTRGNPIGLILQYQADPSLVTEVNGRLWGRFFHDVNEFVKSRSLFSTVIFSSATSWLGFPCSNSTYDSRTLSETWYAKGRELSEDDYRTHTVGNTSIIERTVTR